MCTQEISQGIISVMSERGGGRSLEIRRKGGIKGRVEGKNRQRSKGPSYLPILMLANLQQHKNATILFLRMWSPSTSLNCCS